ncbi:glycosyltransferase family 4 protein [Modestobacter versicolor]|uniref:glycosyltransferase family 4 protein n=1 Tax=Modestobacter versicolor TaxID=429133 RepID=UPI0034DFEB21
MGIDATPLIGQRTGVGRYVHALVGALAGRPSVDLRATAFTLRGRRDLAAALPPGVPAVARPAPARLLRSSWSRGGPPPVEWLCGRVQVFHGTNFVLPPRRRAAGVLTVHDLGFLHLPETLAAANLVYRDLVPRGVREAAVTLTPTETVRQEVLAEFGVSPGRVLVTPLGVDDRWFAAPGDPPSVLDAAGRPVLDGPPYVLFVGSVEPRKGLPTLVEALRRCPAGSAPRLVVAGPAGWGTPLETEASLDVVRTGFLGDEQLHALVAGAAALALPSRYEGFGLPVLEALAAGTPVLASDLPVLREVGGDHASYLPVGDADAWAAALTAAAEVRGGHDPAPGRSWARRWTWDACADATEAAYARAALGG